MDLPTFLMLPMSHLKIISVVFLEGRLIVKDLSIKHKFSALKIKCSSLFE